MMMRRAFCGCLIRVLIEGIDRPPRCRLAALDFDQLCGNERASLAIDLDDKVARLQVVDGAALRVHGRTSTVIKSTPARNSDWESCAAADRQR